MDLLPLILDGILILIFAAAIIDGRRKGFVKTVLSLAATVISMLIAVEYSSPVAQSINENFIRDRGVEWLTKLISDNINSGAQTVIDMIPQSVIEAVNTFADVSAETLISGIATSADISAAAEQIYAAAENAFIISAITVIVFLVIYAISNLILSLLISLINKIFKLPVLKGLNKLLGGIIGAVKGVFGVFILCAVLVAITRLFTGTSLQTAVEGSEITQFVCKIISLF